VCAEVFPKAGDKGRRSRKRCTREASQVRTKTTVDQELGATSREREFEKEYALREELAGRCGMDRRK